MTRCLYHVMKFCHLTRGMSERGATIPQGVGDVITINGRWQWGRPQVRRDTVTVGLGAA